MMQATTEEGLVNAYGGICTHLVGLTLIHPEGTLLAVLHLVRRFQMSSRFLVCTITAVVGLGLATRVNAQSSTAKTSTPHKTPWGDPDLQGVWPGTGLIGTPLQRDASFGTRT